MYVNLDPAPGLVPLKARMGIVAAIGKRKNNDNYNYAKNPNSPIKKAPEFVDVHAAVNPGDVVYVSPPDVEEAVATGHYERSGDGEAMTRIKAAGAKRVTGKLSTEAREAARAAGLGVS